MSSERQIPGGAFVNETTTNQEQIPGNHYLVEGASGSTVGGAGSPLAPMYFLAT